MLTAHGFNNVVMQRTIERQHAIRLRTKFRKEAAEFRRYFSNAPEDALDSMLKDIYSPLDFTLQDHRPGYIYFLSNPARPDVLKIGYSRNPFKRARQYRAEGFEEYRFRVERFFPVSSMHFVEKAIHEILKDRKLGNEELFKVSVSEATKSLRRLIGPVPILKSEADMKHLLEA